MNEVLGVGRVDGEGVGHFVQMVDGAFGRKLEAVGDSDGVDAFVDQGLGLKRVSSKFRKWLESSLLDLRKVYVSDFNGTKN